MPQKNKKRQTVVTRSLTEIHGKNETLNLPNSPSSLDELLGENLSIYTSKSPEEYERSLAEMNQTDLQAHAYRVGLVPVPDRKVLCDRLIGEYKKWYSRYYTHPSTVGISSVDDINATARKILREGA